MIKTDRNPKYIDNGFDKSYLLPRQTSEIPLSRFCHMCFAKPPSDANYCHKCGKRLPESESVVPCIKTKIVFVALRSPMY